MIEALLITKGHPFEKGPFFELFDTLEGVTTTHVEHPAAQVFLDPARAAPYDVIICYDMPGLLFNDTPGRPPSFIAPPAPVKAGFNALLEAGKPFLFLHHALAGWPTWPDYGEAIGGRFLYTPTEVRGQACADSGYRHGVTYKVECMGAHPVLDGLPDEFEMTDELYLAEIFTRSVTPLLCAQYDFVADNFYSAARAVVDGEMYSNMGWSHTPGSNLIGWVKQAGHSPVVYFQPGDGPSAYANPHYRRLVTNAIYWLASVEARKWAM